MPFQCQNRSIKANDAVTLDFATPESKDPVAALASGFSRVTLQFPGYSDRDINEITTEVTAGNTIGSTVRVQTRSTFTNGIGDSLDVERSSIGIVVLAWTGSSNPNLILNDPPGQASTDNPLGPVDLGQECDPVLAVMRGFSAAFDPGTHKELSRIGGQILAQANSQNEAVITGTAWMEGNGVVAPEGTVSAGFYATGSETDTAAAVGVLPARLTPGEAASFTFDGALKDAAVFVTGFNVQFEGGHHRQVWKLDVGIPGWSIDGNTVTLDAACADISNVHGDDQDNAASYVDILVFGLYA